MMKREGEIKAKRLLDEAPGWFQRDARRFGATVDLRHSSGYKELMGTEFFAFFRILENCEGQVGPWNWTVRRVDGLVNLFARYKD